MVRLCFILLLLTLPAVVRGQFAYTVDTNGLVTITGYTGSSGVVSIPNSIYGYTVVGIARDVCFNQSVVTSVSIPSTVTNIGSRAFADCRNLSSITVDTANPAFSSLDGVLLNKNQSRLVQCPAGKAGAYTVPSGVSIIGSNSFLGCVSLTGVMLPANLQSIEDWAFVWCFGLKSITIPASVARMGTDVFSNCNQLTNATILNSLIQDYEFYGCPALTTVSLGNRVTNVGIYAFAYCPNLARLTTPNILTNIGAFAFQYCYGLTNVMFGEGLINIGNGAFSSCTNLTAVFFQGDAPHLEPIAFSGAPAVIYYLSGTKGWSFQFGGRIALLWNPVMCNCAVRTGQFGFTVNGTAYIPIVIEACANPVQPMWVPLQTCTLTNGSIPFCDSGWTNYPARSYRVRSP